MSWQLIVVADLALMGAFGAVVWLLAGRRASRREQRARDEAFEHQLLHDDLTKLPNRTLFRDRLGLALARGGRDRPEDVMQNADVAVHRAKEAGGARCQVFRQEMSPHPAQRLGIETDLRRALERMEFFVEYQPEVDLASGRVVGME